MGRCIIDKRVLKALALAASHEKTRYYLNGVCLEIRADGVTYVATDGKILVAAYRALEPDTTAEEGKLLSEPFESATLIVPTAFARSIKIGKRDSVLGTLNYDRAPGKMCELDQEPFRTIDGTFVKWRRVLPEPIEKLPPHGSEVQQYNPDLLARLQCIAKEMDGGYAHLHARADAGAAWVSFPGVEEAFGVVMPYRAGTEGDYTCPGWAAMDRG